LPRRERNSKNIVLFTIFDERAGGSFAAGSWFFVTQIAQITQIPPQAPHGGLDPPSEKHSFSHPQKKKNIIFAG